MYKIQKNIDKNNKIIINKQETDNNGCCLSNQKDKRSVREDVEEREALGTTAGGNVNRFNHYGKQ